MSRRLKRLWGVLLVMISCIAIVGWLLWREFHQQQLDEALLAAIKHNDTRTVLALLHIHADPNSHEQDAAPPSVWQFLLTRWRLMRGEKPVSFRQGHTALTLAVQANNTAMVEALVASGARDIGETLVASFDGSSHKGTSCTLLMYASALGNPAIIRALVKGGADVNAREENKETALFYCANAAAVQALTDCGADLNTKDAQKWTALDFFMGQDASVCRALIERGAKDSEALWMAVDFHKMAVLKAMLDAGWDVNIKGNDTGCTPLMTALFSQGHLSPDAALLLIRHGADVNFRDMEGDTPLLLASDGGREWVMSDQSPEVIKALLSRGAQINVQNKEGMTPLMVAALHRRPALVRLLLQHGANRNLRSKDGMTALLLAQKATPSAQKSGRYTKGQVRCQSVTVRLLEAAGAK